MNELINTTILSPEEIHHLKLEYWLEETPQFNVYKKVPKKPEEKIFNKSSDFVIRVYKSPHQKCVRCWKHRPEVRRVFSGRYLDICTECSQTMRENGYSYNIFTSNLPDGSIELTGGTLEQNS